MDTNIRDSPFKSQKNIGVDIIYDRHHMVMPYFPVPFLLGDVYEQSAP